MSSSNRYIIAIDQSTSATKGLLINKEGLIEYKASLEHKQYYPQQDFVEHDPEEILQNTIIVAERLLTQSKITAGDIICMAITNQRETAVIWDRISGRPVHNAVVWQCQRGAKYCNELREQGFTDLVSGKTGLIIDPYFSASKLRWIMKNIPGLKEKSVKGELLLGTMDSWLLWKLTGGRVHATDYTNACRTMLFNIHELQWDTELLSLFELQKSMFPEVKFSDEIFGYTSPAILFDTPVPISGVMGDSHAALFGQHCFTLGTGKATYGTGSSVMMNIGEIPQKPPEGMVTSIGYGMNRKIHYVFEGNIHATGDTINWLKNELKLIESAQEAEELAKGIVDNEGVYLVPAFVGLGAPYWDNRARACISGLSRSSTRAHVARAALESIAYQIKDLIRTMELEGDIQLNELRVDGGPTRNDFLMQFQADMLNRKVVRSEQTEVSAIGAAYLAGMATGFWKGLEEISSLEVPTGIFVPAMEKNEMERLYRGWVTAVRRARLSG